jgi:hypothetical protein
MARAPLYFYIYILTLSREVIMEKEEKICNESGLYKK